jgi:CRP-like cAMP-binding protein
MNPVRHDAAAAQAVPAPAPAPIAEGLEEIFARRGWLASADPRHRAQILAAARTVSLGRGSLVYSAGDAPGGIYGIISGGIGAEGSSSWQSARLGHIFRAGDWFGHTPALTGGHRTLTFRAVEPSRVLTVPLAKLREMMAQDAEILRLVGIMADRGSVLLTNAALDLLTPEAPRRIAAVLLRVTAAHDGLQPDDPRGFLLTQTMLGEMANASRHHVNRVLGDFTQRGWIAKSYNHIRLLDVPALTAFAYTEA